MSSTNGFPFDKIFYTVQEVSNQFGMCRDEIVELGKLGELELHAKNGLGKKPYRITGSSCASYYNRHIQTAGYFDED